MAIQKVTEVFSLIQLPSGNVREYYAVVKEFDPATGLADLQVSRKNTNNNPQFENVTYIEVPAVRILSYPCGLPHVGPKRPGQNDSMNSIYMPSGDMATWMMGVYLSTDPNTGKHSAAFTDDNGGTTVIEFDEMQPAPGTGPSMWIPLNIGFTEDAIKTWFNDPANQGPLP